MRFLVSVIDTEGNMATAEEMTAIDAFNDRLVADGHWVMACGIAGPSTATLIDNRGGKGDVAAGTLFGAGEYMSGFWVIEAGSLDEAIALATEGSRCCNRKVEVRQLLDIEDDAKPSAVSRVLPLAVCTAGAALSVKAPAVLGLSVADAPDTYAVNLGLLVLPWVAALQAWRHRADRRTWLIGVVAVVAALLAVNLFPFADHSATRVLTAIHLPVLGWFAVGALRAGAGWRTPAAGNDFIRFTGEALLYYALTALGGGVLVGLGVAMFAGLGHDITPAVGDWILPCGAAGGLIIASWLADGSERAMGRVTLIVQRTFTPLFAVLLAIFAVTAVPAGLFDTFQRDQLVVFDAMLVVVTALAMYGIAAQSTSRLHRGHDWMLLAMTSGGVIVDGLILLAMLERTLGLGATPNRIAVLGLNVVLLVNLAAITVMQWRRLSGADVGAPARWAARYLPVLAAWSAVVALVLPIAFLGR